MHIQHIVLVDDSELNLRTYTVILERLPNVAVHCFTSGIQALAWSTVHDVDCFVIDYHMPAPDGIELTKLLRQHPATWLVPIIMVTGDHQRSVRYAALDCGVNDFVEKPLDPREFVTRVATFIELHAARKRLDSHVGALSTSLRDEEQRSREHAGRLEVLWRVATDPLFEGDEMLGAVLTQSSEAVRPGEEFVARLFRLEDEHAILVATCFKPKPTELGTMEIGARVPLDETNVAISRDRGTAVAWDDVRTEPSLQHYSRLFELGVRSQIAAPFRSAGRDYVLSYSSHQRTHRTFGSDDFTYVTIVAALLRQMFQQRWQSERIQYQIQFDALTGLMNRTQFRTLVRQAALVPGSCAVAIADVVDFSGLNRRFGNQTGDALLVEVAAGLAAATSGDDFVGRLGGDAFGICLPGVTTEDMLRERLEPYRRVFERPFSTGDRNGREFVSLHVRIGGAVAGPELSFNELLARADLVLKQHHAITTSHIAIYDDGREQTAAAG
jgi:diguanylate cyclase (GGDEF)-like protein